MTSEWSNPKDSTSASSSSQTPPVHELGIPIPAFLQPLLGLDFVPYLPSTVGTSVLSSDPTSLTNLDLEALDLFVGPISDVPSSDQRSCSFGISSPVNKSPVPRSRSLGAISGDPIILEALKPPSTGEPSQETDLNTTRNSKSWRHGIRPRGGRLMHKVRGKIEERRVKKEQRRSRTGSWNGEIVSHCQTPQNTTTAENELLKSIHEHNVFLSSHQSQLQQIQKEAQVVSARANDIYRRIGESQDQIIRLQKALVLSEHRLRRDLKDWEDTKEQLSRLQIDAITASEAVIDSIQQIKDFGPTQSVHSATDLRRSSSPGSDFSDLSLEAGIVDIEAPIGVSSCQRPLRDRAATAPSVIRVDSFIRVHDLDIPDDDYDDDDDNLNLTNSTPSPAQSGKINPSRQNGFVFVDSNIAPILSNLSKLGYRIAVDESNRFCPTKDTERILAKYKTVSPYDNRLDEWPIPSWKAVHGTDILVWTGDIGHTGFGSDWPVVKARCLVDTSPRSLVQFMMDSSRIKEYNKMSQGREDLIRIQEGLDTTEQDSLFGFAGDCKIVKALNKPRLLPKIIETLSLTYSKPLTIAPGCYMTVTRSIFEDNTGEHKSSSANTIRSEMLLGVSIFRPANADHTVTEMTNITHVFSPGVPEMLARRAAPTSAYNIMKDIQSVFLKRK